MSWRVAVLGAGGTIAPAIVADLAASPEVERLLLLDLNATKAERVAAMYGAGKASVVGTLEGCDLDVLVNSGPYRLNLDWMAAALQADCHYVDLGGLYRMTLRQLALHERFVDAGRLAILGIGSSPGKTNLMAARAVQLLDEPPLQIDVYAAGRDPLARPGAFAPPYAVQTLIDELTLAPVVLRDGEPVEIEPLTPGGTVDFGDPIGAGETIYTLHSELATFGESFGCREASFRLSLPPAVLAALREDPDRPAQQQSDQTISVHMVIARGATREVTVRAVTTPSGGFGGGVMSTATPAAAAVRLIARGQVSAVGVLPAERCLQPGLLFKELEARGCAFNVRGTTTDV